MTYCDLLGLAAVSTKEWFLSNAQAKPLSRYFPHAMLLWRPCRRMALLHGLSPEHAAAKGISTGA
jgi:hypothetical protein